MKWYYSERTQLIAGRFENDIYIGTQAAIYGISEKDFIFDLDKLKKGEPNTEFIKSVVEDFYFSFSKKFDYTPAHVTGTVISNDAPPHTIIQSDENSNKVWVNPDHLKYFDSRAIPPTFYIKGERDVVAIYELNKLVGIVCPIRQSAK